MAPVMAAIMSARSVSLVTIGHQRRKGKTRYSQSLQEGQFSKYFP
jgi:hypothetical protein